MDKFISAMQTKNALTANGAITNSSTLNACLDFFSIAGNHSDMQKEFLKAFGEDPQTALRILFWSRDCRGGAGAKHNFQLCMRYLQKHEPKVFSKVMRFIPVFGYWKDLFKCEPTEEVVKYIASMLAMDDDHSLCAKYTPRQGKWAYYLRKELKLATPKTFRKFIVAKTQVVEQLMCARKWNQINYEEVPSVAMNNYAKLFGVHDKARFDKYIQAVKVGKKQIHASVLFPCDVFHKYNQKTNDDVIRALWNNLPDFTEGSTERILPVCDVSGSMFGGFSHPTINPIDVSVSLGVYLSEKNQSAFHNAFMTFSENPELVYLTGNDIINKFKQLAKSNWGFSTNLQATFDLILSQALKHNLSQEDLPTKVLIISDMQFNYCSKNKTNFELIDEKFKNAGYERPGLVFWNVEGSAGNCPATMYDKNVALVSGYSPAIIKSLLGGIILTPMDVMLNTVNAERYQCITL